MRILFFTHLFPSESDPLSGVFNLSRVKALIRRGHSVQVAKPVTLTPPIKLLLPPRTAELKAFLRTIDYRVYRYKDIEVQPLGWIPIPKFFSWYHQVTSMHLCISGKMKRVLDRFSPDLVITSVMHPEGTYSKYIKLIINVPLFSIAEGSEVLLDTTRYRQFEKIVQVVNSFPDINIFVSPKMLEEASSRATFRHARVIKNGYEQDFFNYTGDAKNSSASVCRLVTVGNFDWIKAHDVLLSTVRELEGVNLTIIGAGILAADYRKFLDANKLQHRVSIKGFIDNSVLGNYLRTFDLFCFPSRSESFGVAAVEAMACGLPVVATRVGEMPELIREGFNGYFCDRDSVESLKISIMKAIKTRWDKRAIAGFVRDNYSWGKWAAEIEQLFGETSKPC